MADITITSTNNWKISANQRCIVNYPHDKAIIAGFANDSKNANTQVLQLTSLAVLFIATCEMTSTIR